MFGHLNASLRDDFKMEKPLKFSLLRERLLRSKLFCFLNSTPIGRVFTLTQDFNSGRLNENKIDLNRFFLKTMTMETMTMETTMKQQ